MMRPSDWNPLFHRSLKIVICTAFLAMPSVAFAQKKRSKPAPKKAKIRLPESVRQPGKVDMDVKPVKHSLRSSVKSAANRLDGLIENKLISEGGTPNDLASDEVFLRRVYLDVAGRIPTLKEATDFLASDAPDRRENLIDELLGSPDYVSNMYNFWADTLRLVDRPTNNIIGEPFLHYVKESICTNKPYDKWVYEMLTAEGKSWENPAVGYQLRDDGMPLPYIDNTVRVFLGTQIGCAQCHDHPFDQWTQYQFYELAAFTTGTRTRIVKGDPGFTKTNPANAMITEARKHYDKGRVPGHMQRLIRANSYRVSEAPRAMRLPHDYAYEDAKPKEVVPAAVLWGEVPTSAKNSSPRQKFAAWLTSPENPQFSNTIVNRLWKRFMGVGMVEPIDDFRDEHPCVNKKAMAFLGEELIRGGFDLKELTRLILYSETYQRVATDYTLTSGEPYYFPGPTVRRMTAEQVWDSLLTMAVQNPWPFQRPTTQEFADVIDLDFATATYETAAEKAERFLSTVDLGARRKLERTHSYQGNTLCRASELVSPVPASHFLRQFGQGDRETINGSQQEATVPQILAMFNGPITHVMLEPGSSIVDNILAIEKTKDRIDAIFLSVLARRPIPKDRVIAARELSQQTNDNVGYGNILWALLNTREFLFIQ
ncbi:DUF1549 and DUF1553 domain-containing protein [Planctomycetes bacterium K23_9]|uniref:Cytochrome c domain-containing protein n=1 Tax=Stieleria marina TaxID=1930275 RepID=A0A517NQI5_9BACT|nr:hypothetical protein K239x_13200 [Planctomycetes bacterium K23_9]